MRKKDSDNSTHFRATDRVFNQNGKWFFQTREQDHGPYSSREAAARDLKRYVEEMSYFDGINHRPQVKAAKTERNFADFKLIDKDA